jgi:hypothetical protein
MNSSRKGVGCLVFLLTALFVGLKLTSYTNWSWFLVFSPVWVAALSSLWIVILVSIVGLVLGLSKGE